MRNVCSHHKIIGSSNKNGKIQTSTKYIQLLVDKHPCSSVAGDFAQDVEYLISRSIYNYVGAETLSLSMIRR